MTIQITAPRTVTWPDGIGRERVLATAASNSRSVMSFHVHPAPRMSQAPIAHPMPIQRWVRVNAPVDKAATVKLHQHGISKSHVPIGRSARLSRRNPRDQAGAKVSTQLPLTASATVPGVSGVCSVPDIWSAP